MAKKEVTNAKTKVLISGYIGFQNFGDDAMLSLLVKHLKEKDCEITALSSNPKETMETFGINAVAYKDIGAIIRAVKGSDILISGGGNLFQDETSLPSLLYYASVIFLAKFFMKKVFIYSQGIGPVNTFLGKFITKMAFKLADDITVRDNYTQRMLLKWKIKSKFNFDSVWSMDTPERTPENIVGIQLRDYKDMHRNTLLYLAKYIDMFFSELQIKIFCMENKRDTQIAYKLEKAIKARNNNLKPKIIPYKNPDQIAYEFSKLNYLIAMRLHANILGLKMGIKVLPLSYSVKVENLAKELGINYADVKTDNNFHSLFTDLTSQEQFNEKINNAINRKYNWGYLDMLLNK